MERILKNLVDPFQLLHKDADYNEGSEIAKERARRQRAITIEYRKAYDAALNAGFTKKQLSEWGLYNYDLYPEMVSIYKNDDSKTESFKPNKNRNIRALIDTPMKGGTDIFRVGAGLAGEIPDLPVIPVPEMSQVINNNALEEGQAQADELERIVNRRSIGEIVSEPSPNFRRSSIAKEAEKKDLIMKLVNSTGKPEAYYSHLSITALRMLLDADKEAGEGKYSTRTEEKEEKEEKEVNSSDESSSGNESDTIYEELMARVAKIERSIKTSRSGINKNEVHKQFLKKIITKLAATNDILPRLTIATKTKISKADMIKLLKNLNNEDAEDLLHLFNVFNIDLGTPRLDASEAQSSSEFESRVINQMTSLNAEDQKKFMIAFNNKLRKLYISKALAENKRAAENKKISNYIPELTAAQRSIAESFGSIKIEEMQGEELEKERNVSDFINIENTGLLTNFQQLLELTGFEQYQISAIMTQIENAASEAYNNAMFRLGEDPYISDIVKKNKATEAAYNQIIAILLTKIQAVEDKIRNLRTHDKLANILYIFGAVKTSASEAIKLVKNMSTISNFNDFLININKMKNLLNEVKDDFKQQVNEVGARTGYEFSDIIDELEREESNFSSRSTVYSGSDDYPSDITEYSGSDDYSSSGSDVELPESLYDVPIGNIMSDLGLPSRNIINITTRFGGVSLSIPGISLDWSRLTRQQIADEIAIAGGSNTPGEIRRHSNFILDDYKTNEELYRQATERISNKAQLEKIAKKYLNARRGGTPSGDPNDPAVIISVGQRRRRIRMKQLIALLLLLGLGASAIVKYINDLKEKGKVDIPQDKNISDDIPIQKEPISKEPIMNKPIFEKPISNPPINISDPIYGGIGDIRRTTRFKPIEKPILDSKMGADMLTVDDNIKNNESVMKLVNRYNSDAIEFNKTLDQLHNQFSKNATFDKDLLSKLNNIKSDMEKIHTQINQQSDIVPESDYYGTVVAPTIKPSFKSSLGDSIDSVYPFISKDKFTESVGLDDDIDRYNNLAEEYNYFAAKYKDYASPSLANTKEGSAGEVLFKQYDSPAFKEDAAKANSIKIKIEPILNKINAVFKNPSASFSRTKPQEITYADLEPVFDKLTKNDFYSITPEEEKSMRDHPELYRQYQIIKKIGMPNMRSSPQDIKDYEAAINRVSEIKTRVSTVEGATSYVGKSLEDITKTSETQYISIKKEFMDADAKFKNAKTSGMNAYQVGQYYNDLEIKRANLRRARIEYESDLNNYKNADLAKKTYLADMTKEILPTTQEEADLFARLQNVEEILQGHPDALKEYNDRVYNLPSMKLKTALYQKRIRYVEDIAKKYNLTDSYMRGMTEDLSIHAEATEEDPSTIVSFPQNTEDVGRASERANFIDPNEREIFISNTHDIKKEQQRWMKFSNVQPWNGLGDPRTNPLLDNQVQDYMKRYENCDRGPYPNMNDMRSYNRAEIIRQRQALPAESDHPFMPTNQVSFGKEIWENEFSIPTQQQKKVIFTREDNDLPNNKWSTWYPDKGSTYHPDRQIDMYNIDHSATNLQTFNNARRPVYRGIPQNERMQYQSQQVMERGGGTMNNNFGPMPDRIMGQPVQPPKPIMTSLYDNLNLIQKHSMSRRY